MRRLLYLTSLSMVVTLLIAPAALAQQGSECPTGEVSVLRPSGEFICVPENVEDQTPEEIEAVVEDPRPNAETPIVENQDVNPDEDLTPEQQEAAGFDTTTDGQYESPTTTEGQYEAPETAPATETDTVLPDTGGPALLLPAAGLLLATGLIGLKVVRRRS